MQTISKVTSLPTYTIILLTILISPTAVANDSFCSPLKVRVL